MYRPDLRSVKDTVPEEPAGNSALYYYVMCIVLSLHTLSLKSLFLMTPHARIPNGDICISKMD